MRLLQALECLPVDLWHSLRRKRSHVNQVLARAEVGSSYQPARRLWVRAHNGHFLPNPVLLLRMGDGWRPVYEALALNWLDRGSSAADSFHTRPAVAVAQLSDAPT